MAAIDSRRSMDEIARLGHEAYDRHVLPTLQPGDDYKFVAIDVDTGEFEMDEDDYSAIMRLRARRPEAEMWLACIGQPTAYKMRHCG